MRRPLAKSNIRPKISTMPRQRSEAAAFLDIYKLTVEKKRLETELDSLDQRRQRICERLLILDQHINSLENTVDQLREESPSPLEPSPEGRSLPTSHPKAFDTLMLDY